MGCACRDRRRSSAFELQEALGLGDLAKASPTPAQAHAHPPMPHWASRRACRSRTPPRRRKAPGALPRPCMRCHGRFLALELMPRVRTRMPWRFSLRSHSILRCSRQEQCIPQNQRPVPAAGRSSPQAARRTRLVAFDWSIQTPAIRRGRARSVDPASRIAMRSAHLRPLRSRTRAAGSRAETAAAG